MQFILIVVTITAAILVDVRPSGAYQGPWCAAENIGQDVRYDCSMRTLEQCVSLIIAGNRGFCNPNPYYRGPEAAPWLGGASEGFPAARLSRGSRFQYPAMCPPAREGIGCIS